MIMSNDKIYEQNGIYPKRHMIKERTIIIGLWCTIRMYIQVATSNYLIQKVFLCAMV